MLDSILYILAAIFILILIFIIYNVICFMWLIKFQHKIKKEASLNDDYIIENKKAVLNIWLTIALILCRKAKNKIPGFGNEFYNLIFSKVKKVLLAICMIDVILAIVIGSIYIGVQQLSKSMQAVIQWQTFLSDDDDCPCYALCTGNTEDDAKSVYELIFGPTEYNRLCNLMNLTDEEYEIFWGVGRKGTTLNTTTNDHGQTILVHSRGNEIIVSQSGDGRLKSEFIRDHINDEMVLAYKANVLNHKNYRDDGYNRNDWDLETWKEDLYKLLSDYKVNGRNPNCDCKTVNKILISRKCLGVKHWKAGWKWNPIYDEDFSNDEGTSSGGGAHTSAENSVYGIKLDDGWYYWYQQANCGCDHNVNHSTYGRYSDIYLYHPNSNDSNNTAKARGCSTYSTAMAISNALGMEVTPYEVLLTLLDGTISPYGAGYEFSGGVSNGINLSVAPPIMDKNKIAARANAVYGGNGLVATVCGTDQASLDAALAEGAFIVYSFNGQDGNLPWYSGTGHFIVIRKKDENGLYYCLDSNCSDTKAYERMTTGITYAQFSSHVKSVGVAYKGPGTQGGGNQGGNEELLPDLSDDQVYQALKNAGYGKAYALAAAYKAAAPVYGQNFAIGLMANIQAEGSYGVVEYTFSSSGHYHDTHGFSLPSGSTKVKNATDVQYLINESWDTSTKHSYGKGECSPRSCGFGSIQWSFDRRIGLAKKYLSCLSVYDDEHMGAVEVAYMMDEFAGGYHPVVEHCDGKSPEDCARVICKEYEIPKNASAAAEVRAGNATAIKNILSGIK